VKPGHSRCSIELPDTLIGDVKESRTNNGDSTFVKCVRRLLYSALEAEKDETPRAPIEATVLATVEALGLAEVESSALVQDVVERLSEEGRG